MTTPHATPHEKAGACRTHAAHDHQHGDGCGHKAVAHGDHTDYEHDGHLHRVHGSHVDECGDVVPKKA